MSKPLSYNDAPQEIRDAVEQLIKTYGSDPALLAGAIVAATSRAILAAKAEERARWAPAQVYFERYCQDEADDVENCVCGMQQHEDAKSFAAVISDVNTVRKNSED